MTSPPSSLLRIASFVETRLGEILADEQLRWSRFDDDLEAPVGEISRLIQAGGKRLRPAFCHWGFVGAGGAIESPSVIDAGAALELQIGRAHV